MKARAAALFTLVGILAAAIVFVLGDGADAKPQPGFLPAFEDTYPAAIGSRIDSCVLCHNIVGDEYKLNDYAKQWKEDENFTAINNLDADDDGYTNIVEINAHTFPGNAADNPSTVTTTTTVPGATTTTAAPGSGGAIYQANCASCHGGNGGNLLGRSLTLSRITSVVTSGTSGMPGFSGSLSSGEIQTVSQWLFDLNSAPTTTTTTAPGTPPPPPPNGSALFATSCAGCHGSGGGDLAGTTLSRTQLVNTITNGTTGGMPPYSSTYNATQIGAIADYILSLTPPATTTTTTLPGTPPPSPPSGATVYTNNCAACHGANGGNLVGRTITSSQIATAVNNGTTGMPGFSTKLSKAEIDAVISYVAGKTSSTTTTTAPGSPPPSGSSVFSTNCAACHGASGGDLVGHSLTDTQLSSAVVDGKGASMPAFGSRLDSAQINAVVAYLSALRSGSSTPAGLVGGVDGTSLYVKWLIGFQRGVMVASRFQLGFPA
ncbi:MAG: c-type cytochrome [Acidimicrobiia bacterium]|nr:c-type cytochrome [Acidimicrobiia bacterium]